MIANVRRRAASEVTSDMAPILTVEASSVQIRSLTLPSFTPQPRPISRPSADRGEAGCDQGAAPRIAGEPDVHLVHHVGPGDPAVGIGETERAAGPEVAERGVAPQRHQTAVQHE